MIAPKLHLSNGRIALTVEPGRGGAVTELVGGSSGDSWLFFDPARGAGLPADHPVYDDVWRGGFEELFPNDAPGEFDGRDLPDHGELWNQPFQVVEQSGTSVRLRRRCTSVPAEVEKSVSLNADGASVTVRYRLANRGGGVLWHLFKLHPAMRVEAGDALLLPGGIVTPVEPGFGRLDAPGSFRWPVGATARGEPVDLSVVRPAGERFREFVYVSDLPEGWCGLRRARTGESLIISYSTAVFPYCWLFITYGGWRDYNTVVLEPCTNVPKDLGAARAQGTCAALQPGQTSEFSVRVEVRGPDGR